MGTAEEVELGEADAPPRSRARAGLVAAAVVAMGVLVAGQLVGDDVSSEVASGNGDAGVAAPDDDVVTTPPEPSSTPVDETTTTSQPVTTAADARLRDTGEDAVQDDGIRPTTREPADPPGTTTTTVCVDTFEPGCGSFRWATPVGPNRPLTATIELVTGSPVAGEDIEFRVVASDPDATPRWPSVWFGIPGGQGSIEPFNCWGYGAFEGFGPWQPPGPRGGSIDTIVVSRTRQTGSVRVYLCLNSHSWVIPGGVASEHGCPGDGRTHVANLWMCHDPYGSFASPYVDIVVQPTS